MYFLVLNASNKKERVIKSIVTEIEFTDLEKRILNLLQKHYEFSFNQFKSLADDLGIKEDELIAELNSLKARGIITRVGPFFNMDKSSGYVSLVAMKIDEADFEKVKNIVNSFEEVAHNYKRNHELNMWFVIAGISELEVLKTLKKIETMTNYKTYNLPKLREFSLDLYLEV